jgi:hypothetical protein
MWLCWIVKIVVAFFLFHFLSVLIIRVLDCYQNEREREKEKEIINATQQRGFAFAFLEG